jgi:hypothetical protein
LEGTKKAGGRKAQEWHGAMNYQQSTGVGELFF